MELVLTLFLQNDKVFFSRRLRMWLDVHFNHQKLYLLNGLLYICFVELKEQTNPVDKGWGAVSRMVAVSLQVCTL